MGDGDNKEGKASEKPQKASKWPRRCDCFLQRCKNLWWSLTTACQHMKTLYPRSLSGKQGLYMCVITVGLGQMIRHEWILVLIFRNVKPTHGGVANTETIISILIWMLCKTRPGGTREDVITFLYFSNLCDSKYWIGTYSHARCYGYNKAPSNMKCDRVSMKHPLITLWEMFAIGKNSSAFVFHQTPHFAFGDRLSNN